TGFPPRSPSPCVSRMAQHAVLCFATLARASVSGIDGAGIAGGDFRQRFEPAWQPSDLESDLMKRVSLVRSTLLAACLLVMPALAQSPQSSVSADADGRHTLNLKDADIQALIATVSEITGRNFILGPNVQ